MTPLQPTATIAGWLCNLRPEHLIDQIGLLRSKVGRKDFVRYGGRELRFFYENVDRDTGEVTRVYEVKLRWGRSIYAVPVTEDLAIALIKNFCAIASRSAGRGWRSGFVVHEGGR